MIVANERTGDERMTKQMTFGTSHFVSRLAAERYYSAYTSNSVSAVKRKLAEGEIHLGKPTLKEGETLSVGDNGTRYFVTTRA
jgi:hypothetical protein